MYGLANILTEQGFTIEQQCAMLRIIQAAQFLNIDQLPIDMKNVHFTPQEIDAICLATLSSLSGSDNIFNSIYLLGALASEKAEHKEKTRQWLNRVIRALLAEWDEKTTPLITDEIRLAFTPQPAKPSKTEYDTIIVLDSDEQTINDSLDYLGVLFAQPVHTAKILLPATKTDTRIGHLFNRDAHIKIMRQRLKLTDHAPQLTLHENLSRHQFKPFLEAFLQNASNTNQFWQQSHVAQSCMAAYVAQRQQHTPQTLIIVPEDWHEQAKSIIAALTGDTGTFEVIYPSKTPDFTNEDVRKFLTEHCLQHQTLNGTPSIEQSHSTLLGTAAVCAVGLFCVAALNPRHTQTAARLAAEAVAQLAGKAATALK